MFYGIVLGIHVIVCVSLVLIVLMQAAKGGGLAGGSAFGGGGDSTVFGGRGAATFLSKATTVFAAVFMFTSLTLTLLGKNRLEAPSSVVAEEAARTPLGIPGQTAPPTGVPDFQAGPAAGDGTAPALPSGDGAGDAGAPAAIPTTPPAGDAIGGDAAPTPDAGSTEEATSE